MSAFAASNTVDCFPLMPGGNFEVFQCCVARSVSRNCFMLSVHRTIRLLSAWYSSVYSLYERGTKYYVHERPEIRMHTLNQSNASKYCIVELYAFVVCTPYGTRSFCRACLCHEYGTRVARTVASLRRHMSQRYALLWFQVTLLYVLVCRIQRPRLR